MQGHPTWYSGTNSRGSFYATTLDWDVSQLDMDVIAASAVTCYINEHWFACIYSLFTTTMKAAFSEMKTVWNYADTFHISAFPSALQLKM